MAIKALIFDFDGLILDTESAEFQSWQEVFAEYGHELSIELWADLIGRPRSYFDMYAYFKQLTDMAVDIEQLRRAQRARVKELILRQPILPGVLECLGAARELGLKIGLASSSGRRYVCGHLERLELFHFFNATMCFEDTTEHKPNPGPYQAVLDALGVAPHEAVAFEDSPNGIASAHAAGIFCVAVPNPVTLRLPLDHADYCTTSLAAESLPELL
ncbi:MAG: HAD-IA family hydrolase [Candidatus Binatia bacterium]